MQVFYRRLCAFEEAVTATMFASIVGLIFLAAFFRAFNYPLIWADDVASFLFSWVAFLGADIALRHSRLVGVDLLIDAVNPKVRKVLELIVYSIMIVLLTAFVYYGINLSIRNWDRDFQTLSFMSYSAVTLSLPVASVLMFISCATKVVRLIRHFGDDSYRVKDDVPPSPVTTSSTSLV
ncbi:MAG: TRAP transporter small permease [Burkholderiaceae bacterium]